MGKYSKVDQGQIDFILANPRGDVGRTIKKRADRVVLAAKMQVGVQTGRLRRSIKTYDHIRTGTTIQSLKIGSDVYYAYWHHEGTRPGYYKRKNIIATPRGGVRTMRHRQLHKGTRPNRFLSDNVKYMYL
jgi:hypothetical protein